MVSRWRGAGPLHSRRPNPNRLRLVAHQEGPEARNRKGSSLDLQVLVVRLRHARPDREVLLARTVGCRRVSGPGSLPGPYQGRPRLEALRAAANQGAP